MRPRDRRPAFSAWNINCADCGAHAASSGVGSERQPEDDNLRYLAQLHADRNRHTVNLWPHGRRDLTERIEPA